MSHPSTALLDRDGLIAHITAFLAGYDAATLAGIQATLNREIDIAGPEALIRLNERLIAAGADWGYYAHDPLARRIHHLLADRVLEPGSALKGVEHIAAVAGAPVVIFANHLSYSDANVIEVLLHRQGVAELADRLTVIAGPKVYSSLKRRFSSLCFGTIKTPQSSGLSSEDAVMNPRDVARAARRSIDAAHERLSARDALLVFAEGTRSRTTGMQPMLTGVTRYLEVPGTWVLPVGITGSEELFPIGDETVHSVTIEARIGPPIEARALTERAGGDRRAIIDAIGAAIARLLPTEYRGAYAGGEGVGTAPTDVGAASS
jgi:1-acyl-sn-glycerol-3-phosphate acyltransferase